MRARLIRILLYLLLIPPVVAAVAGWFVAPAFLHPIRRHLTPDLIREADASFAASGGHREEFDVRAPDGVMLRGWLVRAPHPNGSWVLLFHGVADNRLGVISQSEFLLRAGYSVVMMDSRAHGASDGPIATFGWLERDDTRAVIDALVLNEVARYTDARVRSVDWKVERTSEAKWQKLFPSDAPPSGRPQHIFALGESMGAGISLQSAAVDPRIEGVVAEAAFANLREASYDYAGLRRWPFLGRTLLRPFSWTLLDRGAKLTGYPISEVSPVKAVAMRPFPVLLICDEDDEALPCRHTKQIYAAAIGPKEFWMAPGAFHTGAIGIQPQEFERRVLDFYANVAAGKPVQ
jgi:uncharacterized protein